MSSFEFFLWYPQLEASSHHFSFDSSVLPYTSGQRRHSLFEDSMLIELAWLYADNLAGSSCSKSSGGTDTGFRPSLLHCESCASVATVQGTDFGGADCKAAGVH